MKSIDISQLSILLVEPSSMQLKLIKTHLQDEGVMNIEAVRTGTEALDSMKNYTPDLVISSFYLPDMQATDLVINMRETPKFSEVAFMLISSETRFETIDPVRQAGVVAILPKPFSHSDLRLALRSTLEMVDPETLKLDDFDIEDLRVLVVDDSSMARKHISRVLGNMGIEQITTANNGKEGVETFINGDFDLIVTDFNMPEMDGQELIECIRGEMGNAYIPILMVTSEENESRLANVQQSGVSAICDKPFEPGNVKEILYRILSNTEAA